MKSFCVFVILSVLQFQNSFAQNLFYCADFSCQEPISTGKTILRYNGKTENHLSFSKNEDIKILSKPSAKDGEDWVAFCRGKVGLVPKLMVREMKMFKYDTKIQYPFDSLPFWTPNEPKIIENADNYVDNPDDKGSPEDGDDYPSEENSEEPNSQSLEQSQEQAKSEPVVKETVSQKQPVQESNSESESSPPILEISPVPKTPLEPNQETFIPTDPLADPEVIVTLTPVEATDNINVVNPTKVPTESQATHLNKIPASANAAAVETVAIENPENPANPEALKTEDSQAPIPNPTPQVLPPAGVETQSQNAPGSSQESMQSSKELEGEFIDIDATHPLNTNPEPVPIPDPVVEPKHPKPKVVTSFPEDTVPVDEEYLPEPPENQEPEPESAKEAIPDSPVASDAAANDEGSLAPKENDVNNNINLDVNPPTETDAETESPAQETEIDPDTASTSSIFSAVKSFSSNIMNTVLPQDLETNENDNDNSIDVDGQTNEKVENPGTEAVADSEATPAIATDAEIPIEALKEDPAVDVNSKAEQPQAESNSPNVETTEAVPAEVHNQNEKSDSDSGVSENVASGENQDPSIGAGAWQPEGQSGNDQIYNPSAEAPPSDPLQEIPSEPLQVKLTSADPPAVQETIVDEPTSVPVTESAPLQVEQPTPVTPVSEPESVPVPEPEVVPVPDSQSLPEIVETVTEIPAVQEPEPEPVPQIVENPSPEIPAEVKAVPEQEPEKLGKEAEAEPVVASIPEQVEQHDHHHHHHNHGHEGHDHNHGHSHSHGHHHHHRHSHSHDDKDTNGSSTMSIIVVVKHLSSTLLSFLPEYLQDTILDVDDALVFTGIIALTLVSICVPYFLMESIMSVRPLKKQVVELNKTLWKVSAAYENQQEEFDTYKKKALAYDEDQKRIEQLEMELQILKKLEGKQKEQVKLLQKQLKTSARAADGIEDLIETAIKEKEIALEERNLLKANYSRIESTLKSKFEELEQAQASGAALALDLEVVNHERDNLTKRLKSVETEMELLKTKLNSETEIRREKQEETERLAKEKDVIATELIDLKRILHQYEDNAGSLADELTAKENELLALKETLGEDSPLIDISETKAKLKSAEEEASTLKSRVETVAFENSSLSRDLEETKTELESVKSKKEEAENNLKVLEGWFKKKEDELRSAVAKLELEQSIKHKDKDDLAKMIRDKESEVQRFISTNEGLKQEIEDMKAAHRNELRTVEAKADENWLSLCQSERKTGEARKEAELLRQKLVALAKEKDGDDSDLLSGIGDVPLYALPLDMVPPPVPDDLGQMASYFPLDEDFVPPLPLPLPLGTEPMRPPPLGRMSPQNPSNYTYGMDMDDDTLSPIVRGNGLGHGHGDRDRDRDRGSITGGGGRGDYSDASSSRSDSPIDHRRPGSRDNWVNENRNDRPIHSHTHQQNQNQHRQQGGGQGPRSHPRGHGGHGPKTSSPIPHGVNL